MTRDERIVREFPTAPTPDQLAAFRLAKAQVEHALEMRRRATRQPIDDTTAAEPVEQQQQADRRG